MRPSVDYDGIADTYDRRYLLNDFSGVENALTAFVTDTPDARVLEVGCGTGHWLRFVNEIFLNEIFLKEIFPNEIFLNEKGIRVAGLDASMRMLSYARMRARCTLVHGLAEHLPWATDSFDRVFCVNALHHFHNKSAFLAEASRVLRPGGRMMTIGLDPHTGIDRWYVYEYFEPALEIDKRRYSASSQIRSWMSAAGFVDCATQEVQHLPGRLSARIALDQGRLDKSATSQLSVLTDEQYDRGIGRIHSAMELAEAQGRSLDLTADLRLYATFGSLPPNVTFPE